MRRRAEQVYRLTGRQAMYSPGAPSLGHEVERRFWQRIATGIASEKAAAAVHRAFWRPDTVNLFQHLTRLLAPSAALRRWPDFLRQEATS